MATHIRIIDLRSLDRHLEGEPLAKDGLEKRRKALEEIVAPLVTTKNTGIVVTFQGRKRYLRRLPARPLFDAVTALQHLYGIEAALKAGDTDRLIRQTVGFAVANAEVENASMFKLGSIDAWAALARSQHDRAKGGAATRKWTPEVEQLANQELDKMNCDGMSPNSIYENLRERLARYKVTVSVDTLRRYLSEVVQR